MGPGVQGVCLLVPSASPFCSHLVAPQSQILPPPHHSYAWESWQLHSFTLFNPIIASRSTRSKEESLQFCRGRLGGVPGGNSRAEICLQEHLLGNGSPNQCLPLVLGPWLLASAAAQPYWPCWCQPWTSSFWCHNKIWHPNLLRNQKNYLYDSFKLPDTVPWNHWGQSFNCNTFLSFCWFLPLNQLQNSLLHVWHNDVTWKWCHHVTSVSRQRSSIYVKLYGFLP